MYLQDLTLLTFIHSLKPYTKIDLKHNCLLTNLILFSDRW